MTAAAIIGPVLGFIAYCALVVWYVNWTWEDSDHG